MTDPQDASRLEKSSEDDLPTVGVVFHLERSEALETAIAVVSWAKARGCAVVAPEAERMQLSGRGIEVSTWMPDASVMLSIGGDGTMLRTVGELRGSSTPIIGVNVGYLGYLTRVEPEAALGSLDVWMDGVEGRDWYIDERSMVQGQLRRADGSDGPSHLALNEIVMEKKEAGHTVRLELCVDGAVFTSYSADGIIVATPTGSTAYSMSAGGPVVSPRVRALLVTPVSPHMIFDRTLVLDTQETIEIRVLGHRPVSVAVDGVPVETLHSGDQVSFTGAAQTARLVRFDSLRFHQILKSKFKLEDH